VIASLCLLLGCVELWLLSDGVAISDSVTAVQHSACLLLPAATVITEIALVQRVKGLPTRLRHNIAPNVIIYSVYY
jgi:hypothetical protein